MAQTAKKRGYYFKMVQTIPDVMYELDKKGRFVFVSEAMKNFGYDPGSLTGKRFESVIYPEDVKKVSRDLVLPRYRGKTTGDDRAPKLFDERRTRKRMTKHLEVRLVPGPGKKGKRGFFYVEVHSSGVWRKMEKGEKSALQGVLGIFRDITHRKFFEHDLKNRYSALFNIIKNNPDGMIVVNKKNEVLFVNRSAEKLYRKKAKDLTGQVFHVPIDGTDPGEIEIVHSPDERTVLGMLVTEIEWEGEDCYLISLRDETENVRVREMFCEESMKDDWTGLYNRRAFMLLADQQIKVSRRRGEKVYLLFADVDSLKGINDTHGHAAGDRALFEVADAMRAVFRESDIVSRIFGDEFAVMGVASRKEDVEKVKNRLKAHIGLLNENNERPYEISLSIGDVFVLPTKETGVEGLLRSADRDMYAQKRARGSGLPPEK